MRSDRAGTASCRLHTRLALNILWIWLAGLGFGGNLVMLWDRSRNPAPLAAFWMLLAVVVTVIAALGILRGFRGALLSSPTVVSNDEIPEIV